MLRNLTIQCLANGYVLTVDGEANEKFVSNAFVAGDEHILFHILTQQVFQFFPNAAITSMADAEQKKEQEYLIKNLTEENQRLADALRKLVGNEGMGTPFVSSRVSATEFAQKDVPYKATPEEHRHFAEALAKSSQPH